jgi:hypothetical protein
MRPKKNGGWDKPFDAREINNNFTEGNSWQYSFFVPQDIDGMIAAYGGKDKFEAKLDEMFNSESKTTGREQADVTGLIGQYAHGNEPSHHMAYLYNYVGKPEKTTQKVHYILDNFYKNTPDGLIGNEDCGQMSAWYVLSSMGIYAVTPGLPNWSLSSPYFSDIKVNFEDKTTKEIFQKMPVRTMENFGINSNYKDIAVGFSYNEIIPVPVIQADGKSFKDKMKITLQHPYAYAEIYHSFDNIKFEKYIEPIEITNSTEIYSYCIEGARKSDCIKGHFFKKPNNYTIDIKSKYNPQYHAGGPEGLIDGINGTENWRKGDWQGYQSQDFEAVIDLQKEQMVHSFSANCLQDSRSWILFPSTVEYYVSNDNVNFTLVGSVKNEISPKYEVNKLQNFEFNSATEINAKYIKVKAYNFGKLPEWHQGFGGDAFIFIDEITIK